MRCGAYEALFGGASGAGNTEVLLVGAAVRVQKPRYRGVVFVRSAAARRAAIERSRRFYEPLGGELRAGVWEFPSGATVDILVGHEVDPDAIEAAWHYMAFDELEVYTESQFEYLITWNRTGDRAIPARLRSTATPAGTGREWIAKRFKQWLVTEELRDGERVRLGRRSRTVIRATLDDNPHADHGHDARLRMAGELDYRQRRHGDWVVVPTQDASPVPATVLDYVPWANPGWVKPTHLRVLAEDIEHAFGPGELERYYTVPPRHAKSETIMNGLAWGLAKFPATPILYATHTANFAWKQSKRIKRLARQSGVMIERGSDRIDEWETTSGGGLVARGVGGEITGRGFKIIVVDDPFKSRQLAEVPTYRKRVWEWLRDDVFTRGTPDASYLVVHTRWMPDDPIGRLIKEGWEGTCLPAICEDEDDALSRAIGEPLAPELGWTLEKLGERRKLVGEYGWASLFQGRPRPRGGKIFNPPAFYTELPKRFKRSYGVDLAYTSNTSSDRSAVVEMLRFDPPAIPGADDRPLPLYFVPAVVSLQERAKDFTARLKLKQKVAPAPMLFIGSGVEKGSADFISDEVPRFRIENASTDKLVRATPLSIAWNDGRVLLPDPERYKVPWLEELLDVFDNFTGKDDPRDDEVDAMAAAFRALDKPGVGPLSGYL